MQHPMREEHYMSVSPLLGTVQECLNMCDHMVTAMLQQQDVRSRRNQIQFLRDCAQICTLMASYLASHSLFAPATATLCAAICQTCGEECAKFRDRESQLCSQICLHCAKACWEFARSH